MKQANLLGEAVAEADFRMLEAAFFETRNYRELVSGEAWRFVVGRRGTGKSALCARLKSYLQEKRLPFLEIRADAESLRALGSRLDAIKCDYEQARSISKLLWKFLTLCEAASVLSMHFSLKSKPISADLQRIRSSYAQLLGEKGCGPLLAAFENQLKPDIPINELPHRIAKGLGLSSLESLVQSAIVELRKHTGSNVKVRCLFDGLDEGWMPTFVSTGIIGGLAKFAADLRESDSGLNCVLFLRDNMARALASHDSDYTRNIEPASLRLHWDEDSLFGMVCERLKVSLGLTADNRVKIWNRFAQRELAGLAGFRRCLKLTLFRPRDIISLLNAAWQNAARSQEREAIVESDLLQGADEVSKNKLRDLEHEYAAVLPGLQQLIWVFRSGAARLTHAEVLDRLAVRLGQSVNGSAQRDLALFSTPAEAFDLLFSVGFLGIERAEGCLFCHDGSDASYKAEATNPFIIVHPAYWRALSLKDIQDVGEFTINVDDSEDIAKQESAVDDVKRKRLSKLGQVAAELKNIKPGPGDAHRFEEWLVTTIKVLLDYALENIELHPNKVSNQRRDVVGRISLGTGFFGRLQRDYDVRHLIFEAKNYPETGPDEFRQSWSYLTSAYGRLLILVTRRGEQEKLSDTEKTWIRCGYLEQQKKMVLLLSADKLQRALEKLRNGKAEADRYLEEKLGALLDQYERSYTHVK